MDWLSEWVSKWAEWVRKIIIYVSFWLLWLFSSRLLNLCTRTNEQLRSYLRWFVTARRKKFIQCFMLFWSPIFVRNAVLTPKISTHTNLMPNLHYILGISNIVRKYQVSANNSATVNFRGQIDTRGRLLNKIQTLYSGCSSAPKILLFVYQHFSLII